MRLNNLDKINEQPKIQAQHFIIPICAAIVVGYFLIFAFKLLKILGLLAIQYWYAFILALLIILFLRRRKKKK